MSRLHLISTLLLALLALAPLALAPFLGVRLFGDLPPDPPPALAPDAPVRLVTTPIVRESGRGGEYLIAAVDLPSPAAADRLCNRLPYVFQAVQFFVDDNPERIDPAHRIPGRDPVLAIAIAEAVPGTDPTAARLTALSDIAGLYPRRDVVECRMLDGRRQAARAAG